MGFGWIWQIHADSCGIRCSELLQLAQDQSPEAPIRTAHEKRAASQDTANGDANELTSRGATPKRGESF